MEHQAPSKALAANLAETRVAGIGVPPAHHRFLELSASSWGIHQRGKELILEYNHPYSNRSLVVEQWREVVLGDFWFYDSLTEAESAFAILIDIGKDLLRSAPREDERRRVVETLLEFVERLSEQPAIRERLVGLCLDILKEHVVSDSSNASNSARYFQIRLGKAARLPQFAQEVFAITKAVLEQCVGFWEATSNVEGWFGERRELFSRDYTALVSAISGQYFSELREEIRKAAFWDELTRVPSFDQIAEHFRQSAERFDTPLDRMYFLSYLLHLPGMTNSRDRLLLDMNRLLKDVCATFNEKEFVSFTKNLFTLFGEFKTKHMSDLLDCFLTLGQEVVRTNNQKLVDVFVEELIRFGFVSPGVVQVGEDWQVKVDPNHVKNIRTWLELIEYAPLTMRRLLSALIVNLRLGGIFISDTNLFQRDVTKLLRANVGPVYNRIRQLCRIFPVYFTEIGCEGRLRDLTTAIDQLSQRQDRLVHFFRKQTHAESNNTHIALTRAIMQFWFDGQLEHLKEFVPVDVLRSIDLDSEWFAPINSMVRELCSSGRYTPEQLLGLGKQELETLLAGLTARNERDEKRLQYLVEIYALLKEKYSFETQDIIPILRQHTYLSKTLVDDLAQALERQDLEGALRQIFLIMHDLNRVILDPQESEPWENIYRKRHIAAGIPSMYGQYREQKFEALGLTFRLEVLASRLMEQLVQSINLDYVTARILRRIHDVLSLFREGLAADGVYNQGFDYHLQMLQYTFSSSSFSLSQYTNILRFLKQDVKDIITTYFLRPYDVPLRIILAAQSEQQGIPEGDAKRVETEISEKFYRQVISSAFFIQSLDNFLSASLNAAHNTQDSFPGDLVHKAMTYNPDLLVSPLSEQTPTMDNPVFLGQKAFFLKRLRSLGFPVPLGFVLTTELFRHEDAIFRHPLMVRELYEIIQGYIAWLEQHTGRQLGNPKRPLLLSVRSGTTFSMPGAMNTFLNVGMNDKIAERYSSQPGLAWGVWDCYRRLLQSWGMSQGIERDAFDRLMQAFKSAEGVEDKAQFSPAQMRELAYEYRALLAQRGVDFEQDPFLQLVGAVRSVLSSWSSHRTKVYRERMEIADEWGTAVIVQRMVFGNINARSGSGVVFTRDQGDLTGVHLRGDYKTCSQGEDIVAGLVHPLPVSERQVEKELPKSGPSLEAAFPAIYRRLVELATDMIEQHGFSHQEIEFTFESEQPGDLYLLQVRADSVEPPDGRPVFAVAQDQMHLVGRGIGVGGGALSGRLAIDMDDLEAISQNHPEEKLVLVRPDTVPDDIGMIFRCDGLLTGRGGMTSHAAVTATRLGKVCVVGCKALVVDELEKSCTIGGVKFRPGDKISIDGYLGNVYLGEYPTRYIKGT